VETVKTHLVAAVAEELGSLDGRALGVGVVAAAAATARLLAAGEASGVVLLGTAGSFPGGPPVGSVVRARRLGLGDAAVAMGWGYVPGAPVELVADAALSSRIQAVEADVLTNIAITTDPELALRYAVAWRVEHMECFGVAWACAQAGVPFAAVLGITNEVGPGAHAAWVANREACEAAVRAVVAGGLAGGL
jgi:nucleoside phosphorylase